MRKLLYVPIIHSESDLGSLGAAIDKRSASLYGEKRWAEHKETVARFWRSVADYLLSLDAASLKLYQDGLAANGELARRIVEEAAMTEERRQTACKAYEEADKLAKEAWEDIKKAHKKKEKEAQEEAVKGFCKAMELVYKTWPNVVQELRLQVDTFATETAYLAGYSEATRGYGLTFDLGVKRGDHVAARTLYKASRIWPWG